MRTIIPELNPGAGVRTGNISIGRLNLFLVVNLFLVISCGMILGKEVILGGFVLESAMLLLTLGYVGLQGMSFRRTFRLKIPGLKEIGLTLIISAAGIYVASFIDQLFRFYIQNLGSLPEPKIPQPQNVGDLLLTLAAIALLPALAEEALFRGVILKGYQDSLPTGKAIFISALFFGMAHLSISNFWGPFILGLLCGWLVCRSESILPAIIAHFLNNSLTIMVAYFNPDLRESGTITVQDLTAAFPQFIVAGGILLLLLWRYQRGFKTLDQGKEKLVIIFKHWSTWVFMALFGFFAILEFLMIRRIL